MLAIYNLLISFFFTVDGVHERNFEGENRHKHRELSAHARRLEKSFNSDCFPTRHMLKTKTSPGKLLSPQRQRN